MQSESRRWANDRVKFSGMCWTITRPGASSGRASRKTLRASVPPVEAPTTMTFSVVSVRILFLAAGRTASAVSLGLGWSSSSGRARERRATLAARTVSLMRMSDSSRNCFVPSFGFVMTSTAPYASAFMMESEPSTARLEQMMVGMGCCVMICWRKVNPSILGISISSSMTSGSSSAILSAAAKGSPTAPMTSMSSESLRSRVRDCLTEAESSTRRTLIFFFMSTSPFHFFM